MKISLNGLDLPRHAEGALTVREVLHELREEIYASGKLLLQAVLDGVPIPLNSNSDYRLNTPVSLAKQLELTIDEPVHASRQILKDSCALIERLTHRTAELAGKFRLGKHVVASNELVQFLDELKLILGGLDVVTNGRSDSSNLTELRRRLELSAEQLAPTLDRIYLAQTSGDTITIADEIQYQLPAQIENLKDLATAAERAIDANSAAPITASSGLQ